MGPPSLQALAAAAHAGTHSVFGSHPREAGRGHAPVDHGHAAVAAGVREAVAGGRQLAEQPAVPRIALTAHRGSHAVAAARGAARLRAARGASRPGARLRGGRARARAARALVARGRARRAAQAGHGPRRCARAARRAAVAPRAHLPRPVQRAQILAIAVRAAQACTGLPCSVKRPEAHAGTRMKPQLRGAGGVPSRQTARTAPCCTAATASARAGPRTRPRPAAARRRPCSARRAARRRRRSARCRAPTAPAPSSAGGTPRCRTRGARWRRGLRGARRPTHIRRPGHGTRGALCHTHADPQLYASLPGPTLRALATEHCAQPCTCSAQLHDRAQQGGQMTAQGCA